MPNADASPSDSAPPGFRLVLRELTEPKDTNHQGSIFGGFILSLVDQAGYLEARRHGRHRWVTVAMDSVVFHAPVWTGDVVALYARTASVGRTSVRVEVRVEAERHDSGERIAVTEATVTMVSTDARGKPIPHAGTGA